MEKNYYEILEINKNATKEIMDKAYKTLIKKYHPDLQENNFKKNMKKNKNIQNKIKYKKFKDYLKGLLVILIIFFINSFYQKNYI